MSDWTGTWNYGYDANNRLTTATPPNPVPDQPAGGPYGYDWVGNRLNPPAGTNHMVYNKADQLTCWPGMHTYAYNGDGSLHYEYNSTGTTALKTYAYTADGLLSSATFNGTTLSNSWDADNNRVSFAAGGTTHTFVYDTIAEIPAAIQEDGVYYIREPDGSLIARINGSNMSYYHFDALGSTRVLTDASGNTTDKYSYDAYGSLISHEGATEQPYQYVGAYGYYTHYQVPEFGLLQLGVRFYDHEVGRFTQRDRVRRMTVTSYSYSDSKTTRLTDPTGLWTEDRPCAGISPGTVFAGYCSITIACKECSQCAAQFFRTDWVLETITDAWEDVKKRRIPIDELMPSVSLAGCIQNGEYVCDGSAGYKGHEISYSRTGEPSGSKALFTIIDCLTHVDDDDLRQFMWDFFMDYKGDPCP